MSRKLLPLKNTFPTYMGIYTVLSCTNFSSAFILPFYPFFKKKFIFHFHLCKLKKIKSAISDPLRTWKGTRKLANQPVRRKSRVTRRWKARLVP